ncbi:hypothetical protein NL676_020236 [Syzygium grande]|nr:hypothetical protein NL676_020236 [Syzygium grande]
MPRRLVGPGVTRIASVAGGAGPSDLILAGNGSESDVFPGGGGGGGVPPCEHGPWACEFCMFLDSVFGLVWVMTGLWKMVGRLAGEKTRGDRSGATGHRGEQKNRTEPVNSGSLLSLKLGTGEYQSGSRFQM